MSQNLTVSDGTTDGTVNLKNQKLTVSGTNGVTTTVNGQTVTAVSYTHLDIQLSSWQIAKQQGAIQK